MSSLVEFEWIREWKSVLPAHVKYTSVSRIFPPKNKHLPHYMVPKIKYSIFSLVDAEENHFFIKVISPNSMVSSPDFIPSALGKSTNLSVELGRFLHLEHILGVNDAFLNCQPIQIAYSSSNNICVLYKLKFAMRCSLVDWLQENQSDGIKRRQFALDLIQKLKSMLEHGYIVHGCNAWTLFVTYNDKPFLSSYDIIHPAHFMTYNATALTHYPGFSYVTRVIQPKRKAAKKRKAPKPKALININETRNLDNMLEEYKLANYNQMLVDSLAQTAVTLVTLISGVYPQLQRPSQHFCAPDRICSVPWIPNVLANNLMIETHKIICGDVKEIRLCIETSNNFDEALKKFEMGIERLSAYLSIN